MKNLRSFITLILLAGVAIYGTFALRQPPASVQSSGELLFPGLLERVNEASRIEIESGGEKFELAVQDGAWTVPGRGGYPANPSSVRQLLIGAASLIRVEPKTSNPELYAKLELDDPSGADSSGRAVRVSDEAGTAIAELIVGKQRPARGDPKLNEYYVRLPSDPQSWLVQGKLPEGTAQLDWIDKSVLEIDADRVRAVTVRHADDETVVVKRATPHAKDFELDSLPEGAELNDKWRVNDLGRGLASLEFEDVASAATADGAEPVYTVTLESFDGLVIELDAGKAGESTVGTLSARFEPPESAGGESEEKTDAQNTDGATGPDPEAVKAEVETLNARWRGWRYTLPKFKAGYFERKRGDLIKTDVEQSLENTLNAPSADEAIPAPGAGGTDSGG